ncbi:MAG: hypothetical protein H6711_03710 [Myxococcales bacterium]|nr:hypothetical protein [Myxococcales bacterium]
MHPRSSPSRGRRPRGPELLLFTGLLCVGGCFDEIIPDPGATEGGTSTSGASMSATSGTSTGGTSGASGSTLGGSTGGAATDGSDGDTTVATTTTGGDAGIDELCPAADHLCDGESWKVLPCDGCAELTPIAECMLTRLGNAAGGVVSVERCEGSCYRDRYYLRPGTDNMLIESRLLDGEGVEVEVSDRRMCTRVDAEFFMGCLVTYDEAKCSSPAAWVSGCEAWDGDACPFQY